MTFVLKLKEMLVKNGMFESQADEVIELMKADKANESMRERWDDGIDGYPQVMVNVMWMSAKRTALEYIEENIPQAWFKPMFQ